MWEQHDRRGLSGPEPLAHNHPLLFPSLPLLITTCDLIHTAGHPSLPGHAAPRTHHTRTMQPSGQPLKPRAQNAAGVVHTLEERWGVGTKNGRAGALTPRAGGQLGEDQSTKAWCPRQGPSLMGQRAAELERESTGPSTGLLPPQGNSTGKKTGYRSPER